MKIFWQKFHFSRSFSVISGGSEYVRGGKFIRRGKMWKLAGIFEEKIDPAHPGNAWKKVAKSVGKAEFCAVTGKISDASFFRFQSAEMSSASQRGAVDFELPRHVLQVPEKYCTQFCPSGRIPDDPSGIIVNAAVFPEKSIREFASFLNDAGVQADEYVFPLLALDEENDTLYLPEIDPEFGYVRDSWMPMPNAECVKANVTVWENRLRKRFILPRGENFVFADFLQLLLAASVVVSGKFRNEPEAFRVLPDNVRPVRFRGHLIMSGLLVLLLVVSLIWRFTLTYGGDITAYRKITSEIKQLKHKSSELKAANKRSSKELKEMNRLVSMTVGEAEAIAEFALISEKLPKDVLVSSIRWNETDIDVVMQSEDGNFDYDALFRPLKMWKVTQQQRQNPGSAVATITLKLTPYNPKEQSKK
ncbi:MAG: hypothetical protein E7058_00050 [Lentisphaerae bacterium]|nr:hypothetical protein [Lentisphaerota bacterium]